MFSAWLGLLVVNAIRLRDVINAYSSLSFVVFAVVLEEPRFLFVFFPPRPPRKVRLPRGPRPSRPPPFDQQSCWKCPCLWQLKHSTLDMSMFLFPLVLRVLVVKASLMG